MEKYTNIKEDLDIIKDLFFKSEINKKEILTELELSEKEFDNILSGQLIPDKIQLENIYNFAYKHNLFLNEITWQEAVDLYSKNNIEVLAHGSRTYIEGNISVEASGESNDFANGFYAGEDLAQAGMWVSNDINSSLYILTFNKQGLNEARFNVDIDWMLAVSYFRGRINRYKDHPRIKEIISKVENCDYVYAPIADNKLFEVIDAFTEGLITDLQCLYAISATHLGYQYVIKTEKALNNLEIKNHLYLCSVEKSMYNRESDVENNTSMNKATIARKKYKEQGQYITELLRNNVNESLLLEAKEDIEKFINKFGQEAYDEFQQYKPRIKNIKDENGKPITTDILYHWKNTSPKDLESILNRAKNREYEKGHQTKLDIEGKPIPKPANTKKISL